MSILENTLSLIKEPDYRAMERASSYIDSLTKPLGSLGLLEEMVIKLAGIKGKIPDNLAKKNIVIMCADNGVCAEGVSSCPQELTATVSTNFTKGITGVNTLAKFNGADLTVVDIGVMSDLTAPEIVNAKIRYGTANFLVEDAMSRDEAIRAIEVGIAMVDRLAKDGCQLLGTGEMGIGNTTTSAALFCGLTGMDSETVTGRGAGLTDEQFEHKKEVVRRGLELRKPNKDDALSVLHKVGGLDLAGLCGVFLGAAKNHLPVFIDGFISSAAALCAVRLNKSVKHYLFASHLSAEPGALFLAKELGLQPMLNLNMRLGEGTGCALAFNVLESALFAMNNMGTMNRAGFEGDFFVDIRNLS